MLRLGTRRPRIMRGKDGVIKPPPRHTTTQEPDGKRDGVIEPVRIGTSLACKRIIIPVAPRFGLKSSFALHVKRDINQPRLRIQARRLSIRRLANIGIYSYIYLCLPIFIYIPVFANLRMDRRRAVEKHARITQFRYHGHPGCQARGFFTLPSNRHIEPKRAVNRYHHPHVQVCRLTVHVRCAVTLPSAGLELVPKSPQLSQLVTAGSLSA